MPPKMPVVAPPSPSPPPPTADDAQDILIISDIMDTLDQIPPELTRVFSDLNELGAVLYATLISLEKKLYTLINWIQDPDVKPEQRFELLQEIAEEAARYKLGGDDKIRVAGGACDGIMAHQKHLANLLAASTLLNPSPPSPYTQTLTLPYQQPVVNSRRLQRAANSPFRNAGKDAGPSNEGRIGDTPTKKKKGRVGQLGNKDKDDDETSSIGGGEKEKKKPTKKRKLVKRAQSPTDSIASTSAFTGKPAEPRTARQLAAAASRARKAEQEDGSDDSPDEGPPHKKGPLAGLPTTVTASSDSSSDGKEGGLGLDMDGSRAGSGAGAGSSKHHHSGIAYRPGVLLSLAKRRDPNLGEGEYSDDDEDGPAHLGGSISGQHRLIKKGSTTNNTYGLGIPHPTEDAAFSEEVDSKVYCTCRQVGYGEMIGCDDDDCEIEWYHLACLNLDKTPEGNWICPRCVERRKKQPKSKKASKAKKSK
ncbi:uncharacterized protein I303_100799 [Kwoniella dejecticola CBS 10117]|uniref:Chromatin modification-related protein n=1 Tax=Kwoniella dejecticola CBS 10117 TaxID=1296121 RepID=A0A1A6AG11_9TREE|nr:uncharacterized protein I303_00801 [Kwoniella dejecticola CBS 10117]OBR88981.1 hypothetical protein I303_00801 [Kwoniella dejecticola CBS 10117]